jgi:hypothetical protein
MIESQIYIYPPGGLVDDTRLNEIVGLMLSAIDESRPNYVKILDPYADIIPLIDILNHNEADIVESGWALLLSFLSDINTIGEISIISSMLTGFKMLSKGRIYASRGMPMISIRNSAFLISAGSIKYRFLYYTNPGRKDNNGPDIPELHDRWLIWGDSKSADGIHIGTSFNNIGSTDITITCLGSKAAQKANYRFDQLYEFGMQRGAL